MVVCYVYHRLFFSDQHLTSQLRKTYCPRYGDRVSVSAIDNAIAYWRKNHRPIGGGSTVADVTAFAEDYVRVFFFFIIIIIYYIYLFFLHRASPQFPPGSKLPLAVS
jgi:hypothetical protein